MIFTSGGMGLASSVGFAPPLITFETHIQISWFIGVIIGTCVSTVVFARTTKKALYYVAAVLLLLNGILLFKESQNATAVICARYADGIAVGLSIVAAVVAGSENAVKGMRGLVLSSEQVGLSTGFFIKINTINIWSYDGSFDSTQMHGIISIIYAVFVFIFNYAFTIESPVYYLQRNKEPEAIESLRRLQKPSEVTTETYDRLNEAKHLLEEDESRGHAVNVATALRPMVRLIVYRVIVAMSISLPITIVLVLGIVATKGSNVWPFYFYGFLRFGGSCLTTNMLDTLGRKFLSALSLAIGGAFLIGAGAKFAGGENLIDSDAMNTMVGLLIGYQLFAGLAAPASTCFLGESFSVSVKPYFIAVVVIIENIVQIIIITAFSGKPNAMSRYVYTLGCLQLAFSVIFYIVMPDTKNSSLREALEKMKSMVNVH